MFDMKCSKSRPLEQFYDQNDTEKGRIMEQNLVIFREGETEYRS